jgi:sugar-specific transcriptional regulator TrmB
MRLEQILENLGLSEAEAIVYRAALELGQALPKHVAEKAGVKRPTLYKLLPGLLEKGLLSETVAGKRRLLVAEDPAVYFEQKQAELEQMEQVLPQLRSLLATASAKPKITFYQGIEGLKKVYMDNLRQRGEILEFLTLEKIHPEMEFKFANYYIPQRIKRRIPIKIILSGPPKSKSIHLKTDPYAFREVKLVDSKLFPVPLDAYIYGDNVSMLLYRSDSEPLGLIIRSKEIATFMRSLFHLIWLRY